MFSLTNSYFHSLPERISVRPWSLAALVAIYITLANNGALITALLDRTDFGTPDGQLSVPIILFGIAAIQFALFMFIGFRSLLKPLLMTFLLGSSILSFFTNQYGVVFDQEMIRNVTAVFTDGNAQEAIELISPSFLLHVFVRGVIPALMIMTVQVRRRSLSADLLSQVTLATSAIVISVLLVAAQYQYLSTFASVNQDLRQLITPLHGIASAEKVLRSTLVSSDRTFVRRGDDAQRRSASTSRTVGILILGETARADHFLLNGYERNTNPLLQYDGVVTYRNVSSCGTATAVSVPCIFSLRTRAEFDTALASYESNVLDVLSSSGIHVVWLDANSGCKKVCARVNFSHVRDSQATTNRGASATHYDAELVDLLRERLDEFSGDTLFVLHMLGSHGPAYSKRYPKEFGVFQPMCHGNSPFKCTRDELVNAYDNTIVYTDFVVHEAIEELRLNRPRMDSFLLYVSDHGESLGENGVFLHGLPYRFAPEAQTRVPMIFWMSDEFARHRQLSRFDLSARAETHYSHDNVSQSLLGLFDVDTTEYVPALDMFR